MLGSGFGCLGASAGCIIEAESRANVQQYACLRNATYPILFCICTCRSNPVVSMRYNKKRVGHQTGDHNNDPIYR